MMKSKLLSQLQEWDGKKVKELETVYLEFHAVEGFVKTLLELPSEVAVAQTWLLKKYIDEKHTIHSEQLDDFISLLPKFEHWQSLLHCLQMFPKLNLEHQSSETIYAFVNRGLNHEVKFVRAWAYQGLFEMAKYNWITKEEVQVLINQAKTIETAGSILSRIRNIQKQIDKLEG